nr:solute carrier family 22 member 7-like isoform X2 [Dermacentor andersoni]
MEFERVLKEIGGFGMFNKTIIAAAVVLGTWHAAICYLGHVLVLVAPPSQWCFGKGVIVSGEALDMTSLPRGRCQFVDEMSDAAGSGDYANFTAHHYTGATCPTGWRYDNAEFFTSITMENEWICGDNWKMYATHTAYWIGSMAGCLISGFLADRMGRKKTILILLALGGSGNAFSALFSSFVGFTALRFITGLGAGTVCSATFVIAIEFTVSHRRSLITLIFAMSWSCLSAALPWYGYLVQSWRILLLSTTVIDFMLAALVCFWVPESPRWLLSVGRKEEALASLERISRINGKKMSRETLNKLLLVRHYAVLQCDHAAARQTRPEHILDLRHCHRFRAARECPLSRPHGFGGSSMVQHRLPVPLRCRLFPPRPTASRVQHMDAGPSRGRHHGDGWRLQRHQPAGARGIPHCYTGQGGASSKAHRRRRWTHGNSSGLAGGARHVHARAGDGSAVSGCHCGGVLPPGNPGAGATAEHRRRRELWKGPDALFLPRIGGQACEEESVA